MSDTYDLQQARHIVSMPNPREAQADTIVRDPHLHATATLMLRAQADIDVSRAYAMHNAADSYQADYHPTQAIDAKAATTTAVRTRSSSILTT